jgi:hypothetical protein
MPCLVPRLLSYTTPNVSGFLLQIFALRAFVLFVEHGPPGRGLSIGQVPVENSKSTGNLPGKLL